MSLLRGKPLLEKLSTLSVVVVLPATMIGALVYSPPDFVYNAQIHSDRSKPPPPTRPLN